MSQFIQHTGLQPVAMGDINDDMIKVADAAERAVRVKVVSGGSGPTPAGTATLTNVAGSASSVTLLSANSSRLGATIYNDSTANLFVKFGATASSSSFTIRMTTQSYYEVPFAYTGRIDGIWASATGNARITEFTA